MTMNLGGIPAPVALPSRVDPVAEPANAPLLDSSTSGSTTDVFAPVVKILDKHY